MKKNNNDTLIKEYLSLIVEDSLKSIFIDPFLDVAKTAAYAIQDLSTRVRSLLKNIIEGLPTLFIPFLEADYSNTRQEEKEQLNKLKEKYADVLKGTDQALVSNDAFGLNFLLFPQNAIAKKILEKTPGAALSILDLLTGGTIPLIQNLKKQITPPQRNPVNYNTQGSWSSGGGMGGDYGNSYIDNYPLNEETNNDLKQQIKNLLKDKNILNKIVDNKTIYSMRKDGINLLASRVQNFLKIKSLDELLSKYNTELNQLNVKINDLNKMNLPPEELEKAKQAILVSLKHQYKAFYIQQLNKLSSLDNNLNPIISKAVNFINSLN